MKNVALHLGISGLLVLSTSVWGEPPHSGRGKASKPVPTQVQRPQVIHTPPVKSNVDGHSVVPGPGRSIERGPTEYTKEDELRDVRAYEEDLENLKGFDPDINQALEGTHGTSPATGEIRRGINSIDYPVDRLPYADDEADSSTF